MKKDLNVILKSHSSDKPKWNISIFLCNTQWLQTHKQKDRSHNDMKTTTPRKEVQKFIDVINYYHNVWPRRSHTLSPLTRLMSIIRKFKLAQVKQGAFDEI